MFTGWNQARPAPSLAPSIAPLQHAAAQKRALQLFAPPALLPAPAIPQPTTLPASLLPAGQPLRLGVDPLHAHLLLPGLSGPVKLHLAFWSAANWVRQLKHKRLDAVLLPLAGMVGPSEPPEPPALTAASALNPSLGDPEVVAIALATTGLPFLVAGHHLVLPGTPAAPATASQRPAALPRPAVLLPPACHQPLLHADLRRQGLLSLRTCDSLDPAAWVELLQSERLLLPALPSLLAHSPWREAGLITLPAADPLWEALWLLVRQEQLGAGWVEELGVEVREGVGT